MGYTDADWANDIIDRKSISGFCFKLNDNLVSWACKKQSLVTLCTESEFVALCMASCELLHIKNILDALNLNYSLPIVLYEDNQSTIRLLQNFENNKRCKHVEVKFHFVVDLILKNIIRVVYVNTNEQLADILTKGLSHEKFSHFVKMLNLVEFT